MFRHRNKKTLIPLDDRGPLHVMFVITSMPVGGQETLLVELVRRLDRERFLPELCCLKHFGPLGEVLSREIPAFTGLLAHKFDFRVLCRLVRLIRQRRIDAIVTVGAGDKMFWGRLAGWSAGVPVICSALHTIGPPDRVERSNRLLAPLTDAFIAVAHSQGKYLAEHEGCPADKVHVIPNGVDLARFHPSWPDPTLQKEFGLTPQTPVAGIVAALRPEKNHDLFLKAAALVHQQLPKARFLVVGDGPERQRLESLARELSLTEVVRFLGTRTDVPALLSLMDVLVLTSNREASPVSVLEAMAMEKPVIATRVGSLEETIVDGKTGLLVAPDDVDGIAYRLMGLLRRRARAAAMGRAGREQAIAHWSIDRTVAGYENLIAGLYTTKATRKPTIGDPRATNVTSNLAAG